MISAHCAGGVTLVGESLQAIARREFGARAFYSKNEDKDQPEVGYFLHPVLDQVDAYWVCARVLTVKDFFA